MLGLEAVEHGDPTLFPTAKNGTEGATGYGTAVKVFDAMVALHNEHDDRLAALEAELRARPF